MYFLTSGNALCKYATVVLMPNLWA